MQNISHTPKRTRTCHRDRDDSGLSNLFKYKYAYTHMYNTYEHTDAHLYICIW